MTTIKFEVTEEKLEKFIKFIAKQGPKREHTKSIKKIRDAADQTFVKINEEPQKKIAEEVVPTKDKALISEQDAVELVKKMKRKQYQSGLGVNFIVSELHKITDLDAFTL